MKWFSSKSGKINEKTTILGRSNGVVNKNVLRAKKKNEICSEPVLTIYPHQNISLNNNINNNTRNQNQKASKTEKLPDLDVNLCEFFSCKFIILYLLYMCLSLKFSFIKFV